MTKRDREIKTINQNIINRISNIPVTPDNYYSILGDVQNSPSLQMIDIVTFTGLMNWDEKLVHLNKYIKRLSE